MPKQIILLITISFLTFQLSAQTSLPNINTTQTDSVSLNYSQSQLTLADSIINFGKKYLRKPYNYRPNSQTRFDCSGFASFVYSNFGYNLKRSSAEQAQQFGKIDRNKLKKGDLVFFSGRRKSSRVGHVGIVVNATEDGKFEFIHSSNQSGIVISNSNEDYYARRYISAGRVINDSLFIATIPSNVKPKQESLVAENLPEKKPEEIKSTTPPQFHIVKKGDTLYSISRKYGLTVAQLKKNNQLISDKIMPTQQLKVVD